MAGHSKFKNIMHRKGAQDAKRAKIFAKLAREVTVAAKTGGEDSGMNARLRSAVAAAKAQNMPNENVQRAIAKAMGGGEGADFEEIRYEGYGPSGIAIIIETLTDNRNRTASEVRSAFTKYGGTLGESNSVSYLFDRVGLILYPITVGSIEEVFDMSLECGASDVEQINSYHEITSKPEDFSTVRDGLEKRFGTAESANLGWRPRNLVPIIGDEMKTVLKFLEVLEDNDDIQRIAFNVEIKDDEAETSIT